VFDVSSADELVQLLGVLRKSPELGDAVLEVRDFDKGC